MPKPPVDFRGILRVLHDHNVDFIVVGGVSAVLNGAPISTFDLDIVHSRTSTNIASLLDALTDLNATYRFSPVKRVPDISYLASTGHQLLMTDHGPLDLLGAIGDNQDYDILLDKTTVMQIEANFSIRVLKLETLIEIKRALGDAKDLAALPVLERTLRERNK